LPIAGIAGRIAGIYAKVPVIYTEHNKWERYHRITYWLNKLSFSKQDTVIAVSSEVKRSIELHYNGTQPQVQVIVNGVDTKKFDRNVIAGDIRRQLKIPANAIVIGIACVFRSQKRLDIWLEIAAELHKKHPGLEFLVVGDGVLRDEVKDAADRLNTNEYVHFAGLQAEVRPYLQAMDIFMMTSEFEGLPIALLEAMSMSCVPACTAAGGIAEVVQNGINGILVPVEDPKQLVNEIDNFLQQPAALARMRTEARKTVQRSFGMQQMVSQIESIYHSTLEKKL